MKLEPSKVVELLELIAHGTEDERRAATAAYEAAVRVPDDGERLLLAVMRMTYGTATLHALTRTHGRLLAATNAFIADAVPWFSGSVPPVEPRDA